MDARVDDRVGVDDQDVHGDRSADRAAGPDGTREREVLQTHRGRGVRAEDAGRRDRRVRADLRLDIEVRVVDADGSGNARVRLAAGGREAPDDDVVAAADRRDRLDRDAGAGDVRALADAALALDLDVVEADGGADERVARAGADVVGKAGRDRRASTSWVAPTRIAPVPLSVSDGATVALLVTSIQFTATAAATPTLPPPPWPDWLLDCELPLAAWSFAVGSVLVLVLPLVGELPLLTLLSACVSALDPDDDSPFALACTSLPRRRWRSR